MKTTADEVFKLLRAAYPDARCELDFTSPFQLLVAPVLSAQSTDVGVNKVTPVLFGRWPTPQALAGADLVAVVGEAGQAGGVDRVEGLDAELLGGHVGSPLRPSCARIRSCSR